METAHYAFTAGASYGIIESEEGGALPEFKEKVAKDMKTTITARQMSVTEDLKAAAEKKLRKFDKFFPGEAEANVVFSRLREKECLEVTISYGGTLFRAEQRRDTFLNALDECVEAIERQIRKNKTKIERRYRETPFPFVPDELPVDPLPDGEPEIRVKTFPLKPMTAEEAILQLDLIGHAFYVFKDAASGETCVVYKRHDDTYGLIIPE